MRSRTLRRLEPGRNVRGSPWNVGAPLHLNVSLLQHKSTPPDDAGTTPARIQTTVTAESAAADGHMKDAESLSVAPNPIMATSAHFCAMGNAVEMVADERFVLRCSMRRTRAGRERETETERKTDRQVDRERQRQRDRESWRALCVPVCVSTFYRVLVVLRVLMDRLGEPSSAALQDASRCAAGVAICLQTEQQERGGLLPFWLKAGALHLA